MTGRTNHAANKSSAKVPAWTVLITMGGTSIILNFWDATHAPHPLFLLIAGLRGFAPVFAAMGLSEAGARFEGGQVVRRVCFGIMCGAMLLSASAVANVLRPSYPAGLLGLALSWLFGIVLDAAALTCLWIILTERERRREAERQGEATAAAQAMAVAPAAGGAIEGPAGGAAGGAIEGPAGGAAGGAIEGPAGGAAGRAIEGPAGGAAGRAIEGPAGGAAQGATGAAGGGPRERTRSRAAAVSQEADAIAARKEYRKSVGRGEPLNDRQLAELFPPRSRNWAAKRIEEALRQPSLATSRTASG